ncbi:MAG: hypothetical protein Q8906_09305 [Bacillota bacterium]|nr:hypothetical protein [Bacillota bacterium]
MSKVEKEQNELEVIIGMLMNRSGSDVQVNIASHFPGNRFAGGKYSMDTHTITLYIEEIKEQCKQSFGSLHRFEEYFTVIFAHELGHAEDRKLAALVELFDECRSEFDRNRIAFLIEKNAWKYAEKLIPDISKAFRKQIIAHSLRPYYEKMELQTA